jgi:hypothetical protein
MKRESIVCKYARGLQKSSCNTPLMDAVRDYFIILPSLFSVKWMIENHAKKGKQAVGNVSLLLSQSHRCEGCQISKLKTPPRKPR